MNKIKCDLCGTDVEVGHILASFDEQEKILGKGNHCHLCLQCKDKYYKEAHEVLVKIDKQIMTDI